MKLIVVFKPIFLCLIAISCFSATVHGYSSLPDLGGNAFSVLTPEKEKQLGDVMMRQTRGSLPMVYDPLMDEYINALGNRMVARANDVKFPFKFYWVRDKNINAFATLGGNIASHTGTLAIADSESEFASVIGHEIAHVTQRHIARFIEARSQQAPLTLAGMLAAIVLATVDPEAGMAAMMATQGASQQSAINFTRSNEQEADRIGMQIMAEAGFDPYAVPEFFRKLTEQSRFINQQLAFLRTHPLSQSRVSDTRLRAEQFTKRFIPDSQDFSLIKARVLARYQYEKQHSEDAFLKKLAQPGGNTKANQYGLAIALLDNKKLTESKTIIEKLLQDDKHNLYYIDVYTDILIAQGEHQQSLDMLEQQYLLRPNNQVVTLNYANAALSAKAYRLAIHLLKSLLFYKEDNILAYSMLADAYEAMEDLPRFYEAQADLSYQLANYPKAIDNIDEAINYLQPEEKLEARRLEAKKKQLQAEFSRLQRM
ncbi:M48 family metalloprotease [Rheinheimera sp. MMS21-TC3]|uniref:beta-barrel assembly-enhancing protease n=1 Tax=Rheinheimera sp. MMS21-TC3 TaxID=3072790 RepID=UPI0028C42C12|nr:M48 family metalloprotease [Rheinheimera sp. MMS21-TC3]WNO60799.1 M48 family metalloprotease [Rheinheimera sp. MMS21-TC3]